MADDGTAAGGGIPAGDGHWAESVAAAAPRLPVLVLRALGLGDGLTAVPALRGLRRAVPDRPLVLACSHPVARLLQLHGVVDRVVPAAGLTGPPPGRHLGRHLAVNLHGRGPRSHRLLLAGGPEGLLAFDCPAAGVQGPGWDPAEHEVSRWCRLVDAAGGRCEPGDLRLKPDVSQDHPPVDVILHPGAAAAARRWPAARWAAVAAALDRAGLRVTVTGSAAERALTARVVRDSGLHPAADAGGRLGLQELAVAVAGARLVLSGDTGVAHLATAFGTRSVTLFGPVPPARWGAAVDPDLHVAIWHGDREGDPHAARPDPGLLRISADEVLASARDLIRS